MTFNLLFIILWIIRLTQLLLWPAKVKEEFSSSNKHVTWFEPPHDKYNTMACAPSEESDQPGHPPSLIRVFAVRSVGSWGPNVSSCGQRRLWSDWAVILFVLSWGGSYVRNMINSGTSIRATAHVHRSQTSALCSSSLELSVKIFYLGFYGQARLFHFWAESLIRWAKTGDPWEKPSDHPQAELGLSHTWPELGSNPQRWDERFNHSATRGTWSVKKAKIHPIPFPAFSFLVYVLSVSQ